MSGTTGVLVQSKKHKRRNGEGISPHGEHELFEELAEEQRLRLLAEQETQRLRQKIENYERRMEKYEERLDKMMTLLEKYEKGRGD
jgi:molecular chaperone GrpE (heat shock protein)